MTHSTMSTTTSSKLNPQARAFQQDPNRAPTSKRSHSDASSTEDSHTTSPNEAKRVKTETLTMHADTVANQQVSAHHSEEE